MTPHLRRSRHSLLHPLGLVAPLVIAGIAVVSAPALGGESDLDAAIWQFEGEARAGWRFVSGESERRFPQDLGLQSGPRLFDFRVAGRALTNNADADADADVEEFEIRANGIGERNTDYELWLAGASGFDARAGFTRDDYSYRATGDPFPYDTERQRTYVRTRFEALRDVAVRLEWQRSTRRGEAFTLVDTDIRENPTPPGVDEDITHERRPLDRRFDDYTVAIDSGMRTDFGTLRYGLTQHVSVGVIDDERVYDIPPSRRTATPVRDTLRRQLRSHSYTTVGKVGALLADGVLDLSVIVTHQTLPVSTRLSGESAGFDNTFGASSLRGAYTGERSGGNRHHRRRVAWRAEALVTPIVDLELAFAAEQDDTLDDTSLSLAERRVYTSSGEAPRVVRTNRKARITDRTDRMSAEAAYQVTEWLRVRAGRERYRQDTTVPNDSPGPQLNPTLRRSTTDRTIAGLDIEPARRLTLSALARRSDDDEPHSNASVERADELSLRARWRTRLGQSDRLSIAATYRDKDFHHTDVFTSSSRSETLSGSVTWTHDRLTTTATASYQRFETRTGTKFFELDGITLLTRRGEVHFETRDVTATLDVQYAFTDELRLIASGLDVDSAGDYRAEYQEGSLGVEFDLRETLTLGATVRAWQFDERNRQIDDYDAKALELSVTYRF